MVSFVYHIHADKTVSYKDPQHKFSRNSGLTDAAVGVVHQESSLISKLRAV